MDFKITPTSRCDRFYQTFTIIGKLNADGMKELPQRVPSTFANAMIKLVCVE
ncbi:MAG: hypothetical protein SAK29_02615 [Scytonema sp. PMC 1069.18]|nr:hypothetical protein [Scytonema sp. PMC 1069.18]MEC4882790.1 hypothetical protein [Scytonema sp. PMC 1070.18]